MSRSERHERFIELFQQHHGRLFGFVFSMLCDRDATQDVLQDTCLTLWEKFDEYDPAAPFTAWAFTVARFKALNYITRQKRRGRFFSEQLISEIAVAQAAVTENEHQSKWEALVQCTQALSESHQRLLWNYYDGKSTVRDLAEAAGRSPQSVHNSLKTIRAKLMDCVRRRMAREGA